MPDASNDIEYRLRLILSSPASFDDTPPYTSVRQLIPTEEEFAKAREIAAKLLWEAASIPAESRMWNSGSISECSYLRQLILFIRWNVPPNGYSLYPSLDSLAAALVKMEGYWNSYREVFGENADALWEALGLMISWKLSYDRDRAYRIWTPLRENLTLALENSPRAFAWSIYAPLYAEALHQHSFLTFMHEFCGMHINDIPAVKNALQDLIRREIEKHGVNQVHGVLYNSTRSLPHGMHQEMIIDVLESLKMPPIFDVTPRWS